MPYGGNLHVSRPLTNVSIMYKNSAFIGAEILPDVQVQKESDQFYVYNRDFRITETLRANKAPANMVTWGISLASYTLEEHALKDLVTDRDISNADSPIAVKADTAEFLTDKILLYQEKEIADLLFTTGTWSNNASCTTATSWVYNTTTSAPIQMVNSGTTAMIRASGQKPNTMILGHSSFMALKDNPNVYNRIQYVERAIVTESILAAIFDVDKVYVGSAVYDAGLEGVAESITAIWGGNALLAYFAPMAGLKKVTAAINLRISGKYKTKTWREEELAGDYVEVNTMYKPRAVATACGYYFNAVTTA